jgi:hypothetical protein
MLTEWDSACESVLGRERGVKNVLGLCGDESGEVRNSGIVVVANLVNARAKLERGGEAVKGNGGKGVIRKLVVESKEEVVRMGVEVLKALG